MDARQRWWSIGCAVLAGLGLWAAAPAGAATVGLALPQGQLLPTAEAAEPVRQSLAAQLKVQSVNVVLLGGASGSALDAEALSQHCDYVLYTRLERKQGGSLFGKLGGMRSLASLAGALPLGALAGKAGGGSLVSAAGQQIASNAASSAVQNQFSSLQQQTGSAAPVPSMAGIKQGDTITLDYRLVQPGARAPVKTETLTLTASSAGQDVVSPLIAQLTTATVAATAPGGAASMPGTAGAPAGTPTPAPTSEAASQNHGSLIGGLFHHASAPKPAAGTGNVDCAQIAAMSAASNGQAVPVSLETCQKLQAAQQTYNQAGTDGARPGDDQMGCEQISAELHQQQFSAPDRDKVTAAQATVTQAQKDIKHGQAVAAKLQVENQATVDAAMAADTATEVATAGVVQGRALQAAEKVVTARNDAANRELVKEAQPTQQKLVEQMAGLGSDAAGQLQSNPRMARLIQLANAKRCRINR